jgi:acetyltransferase-like isoleucine patch superfamily enzyme
MTHGLSISLSIRLLYVFSFTGGTMKIHRFKKHWARFWMRMSGFRFIQGTSNRLATMFVSAQYGQVPLATLSPQGFRSPRARLEHPGLRLGKHCFIGEDVIVYQDIKGGDVFLGNAVHIHRGTVMQTGNEGSIEIGDDTHIQPNCLLSAYKGPIHIGAGVEIAPACAFYPYSHGVKSDLPIREQELTTKGGISVDDDAWLGHGVIVLDGVRIGKGAVIGAGSVVTSDIPDNAIASGSPARVMRFRE